MTKITTSVGIFPTVSLFNHKNFTQISNFVEDDKPDKLRTNIPVEQQPVSDGSTNDSNGKNLKSAHYAGKNYELVETFSGTTLVIY